VKDRSPDPLRAHFPGLDPAVRERLGRLGIDPEASCTAFLEEIRTGPPPKLLRALTMRDPPHGHYRYQAGCRCLKCRGARAVVRRSERDARQAA
jgi:hypothetical protein